MRNGPMLRWFGSKWTSTQHYPKPLPNKPLFEPFAGSACYSMHYWDHDVRIWDTHPDLAILWPWLINEATPDDIMSIPVDVPVGTNIRDLGLSDGQASLMNCWQRTNNCSQKYTVSPWNGKAGGTWGYATRERVANNLFRVKHWKFEPPTWRVAGTYFCDPPYLYNYRYGAKDFDFDLLVLDVICLPVGSLCIVCEAICKKTGRIPKYLPFRPSHKQVTSRKGHSNELVYIQQT